MIRIIAYKSIEVRIFDPATQILAGHSKNKSEEQTFQKGKGGRTELSIQPVVVPLFSGCLRLFLGPCSIPKRIRGPEALRMVFMLLIPGPPKYVT